MQHRTGAWSDFSDKWKEHPGVKMEVWPKQDDNDGCFFMEWKDFLNAFDMIDVCYTGGDGLDSVVMQVDEDYGMCGPAVGCTRGLCKYYCMCASCYRLWMAPTGSHNRTHEDAMKFSILGV